MTSDEISIFSEYDNSFRRISTSCVKEDTIRDFKSYATNKVQLYQRKMSNSYVEYENFGMGNLNDYKSDHIMNLNIDLRVKLLEGQDQEELVH